MIYMYEPHKQNSFYGLYLFIQKGKRAQTSDSEESESANDNGKLLKQIEDLKEDLKSSEESK